MQNLKLKFSIIPISYR